jgi:putative ATP-dependent endonuclease of OLD family
LEIRQLKIENFRGIKSCVLLFSGHTALVGDNNTGKSSILETIDLVLGPERLRRNPVVNEHDFYAGEYLDPDGKPVLIKVEVIITGLTTEQQRHFWDHIEWWNNETNSLLMGPPPEETDQEATISALRLQFVGQYDPEEDDFTGQTFFASPQKENGEFDLFRSPDKRVCGFLFLRTLRTGRRALSLERGSLLDIILKLQEKRLRMWEDVIDKARDIPIAEDPDLEFTEILTAVEAAIRNYVPSEWANNPTMKISDLTRESLRKSITFFMGTGTKCADGSEHLAPFQNQGTGTINALVLALLSLIAELKQNVIFAMEEPEIAIPPHTQKRIIDSVRGKSAQALFTSHSPYVLEEFPPQNILVLQRENGILTGVNASYPPGVTPKKYRDDFRRRYCEALLARRVLIAEGTTEFDVLPIAARRLHELHPNQFKTLEALGIATINAHGDGNIAPLGKLFTELGKSVFAVFDAQSAEKTALIEASVHHPFEAATHSIEDLLIQDTDEGALRRYAISLLQDGLWPTDPEMVELRPDDTRPIEEVKRGLKKYFKRNKGAGSAADMVSQCLKDEMPAFIPETLSAITEQADSQPGAVETVPSTDQGAGDGGDQSD